MIKLIDNYLNRITMYRLVLYYLIVLLFGAVVLSYLHYLPYTPADIILSALFLVAVSWITNTVFAKVFEVATNVESVYITALILALIITPNKPSAVLPFLLWAAVLAMASKYVLAINKKHIFNPAALSVAVTAIALGQSASWWVGTKPMLPLVFLGGVLIVRKIKRFDLVWFFFLSVMITILGFGVFSGLNLFKTTEQLLLLSPIFFFAFVMLTEPLTTPPTRNLQIIYGAFVGLLFVPQMHFGTYYLTPEIALLIGNVFVYMVSPKVRLQLHLKEKLQISSNMYDFIFLKKQNLAFLPGQYLEWTLPHKNPDSRGNRRYLTIASSPTENDVLIGVKFYDNSSSFKKRLIEFEQGDEVFAGQLSGDFVLPKDESKKLVFLAGGIGITPFRSMIKYLTDMKQGRDIVLLYSNKVSEEIAYKDVFDDAEKRIGLKSIYSLTDLARIPKNWSGVVGRLDGKTLVNRIPDYKDRIFYISGPQSFVESMINELKIIGIKNSNVITDYFPGFV